MPVYKVCSLTMSFQKLVAASESNDIEREFISIAPTQRALVSVAHSALVPSSTAHRVSQ